MTFPSVGRQFDKSGNLKQWWDDDVIAKFKEKAQCIVEQYGNYTVPEVGVSVGIAVCELLSIVDTPKSYYSD